MSDDLTAQLRCGIWFKPGVFTPDREGVDALMSEAADRIDADARTIADLTAERDRLRGALRSVRSLAARPVVVAICDAALADPEPECPRCGGAGWLAWWPGSKPAHCPDCTEKEPTDD